MKIITSFRDIDDSRVGESLTAIKGKLVGVQKHYTGTTSTGSSYALQNASLVGDDGSKVGLKFDGHPDMKNWGDRTIYLITGDKAKKPSLEIISEEFKNKTYIKIKVLRSAVITEDPEFGASDKASDEESSSGPEIPKVEYWYYVEGLDPQKTDTAGIQKMINEMIQFQMCREGENEWRSWGDYGFKMQKTEAKKKSKPAPAVPSEPEPTPTPADKPHPDVRLPQSSMVDEMTYQESWQMAQYHQATFTMRASITNKEDMKDTYLYLRHTVRKALAVARSKFAEEGGHQ